MLDAIATWIQSSHFQMALYGLGGSAAVEVLRLVVAYERGSIPARYKKVGFWVVRTVLGLFAGLLVVAYEIQSPILAMHIGAATPAIIQNFASKPPPQP